MGHTKSKTLGAPRVLKTHNENDVLTGYDYFCATYIDTIDDLAPVRYALMADMPPLLDPDDYLI